MITPIRNERDYQNALARIDELFDSIPGTPDHNEMEVLVDLVEKYERDEFAFEVPDVITAINFRLEQTGQTARDLIPFIGSRGRVSEVMAGKRDITMPMARALHKHLGVPASILLGGGVIGDSGASDIDASRFPLREMAKRGWILDMPDLKDRAEEIIRDFINRAGGEKIADIGALYRKNDFRRMNAKTNPYALMAWCWQALIVANENPPSVKYERGTITQEFMRHIAGLSLYEDGPALAKRILAERGIAMSIVGHLPGTHLDGAALWSARGYPVIGLTLRFDRIDNFWFCLLHELAHVGLHIDGAKYGFVDDLRIKSADANEEEADEWARESLIPRSFWDESEARYEPTGANVMRLASRVGVHSAIVAGRVRYEYGNYRMLSQFVGNGEVRRHFQESETK